MIPYQTSRSSDALHQQVVKHTLDILSCLQMLAESANNDDGLLYRILHLRYLEPRTTDLQRLIIAYTSKDRKDPSTLFMWMGDKTKLDALSLQDRAWMEEFAYLTKHCCIITPYTYSLVEWIVHRRDHALIQQPENSLSFR
jgi:hypothetical protein